MKIKFEEDINPAIKAGAELILAPNSVNYITGLNGSGKTITFSSLVDFLSKKLKKKNNFMTPPPLHISQKFSFEGFESVKDIYHYTAKTRQSAWVRLDFDCALGIGGLNASEGMNCQGEIAKLVKDKRIEEENTLFVFDEIDGCLDLRAKRLFFDYILPKIKGTVVVLSHDIYYLTGNDVFDFSLGKKCNFKDVYGEFGLI